MPPAVGNAAAISARANGTTRESPPAIVQLEKAASGPPLASAKPSSIGIPETKFMVVNVAAQFSNMPSPRTRTVARQKIDQPPGVHPYGLYIVTDRTCNKNLAIAQCRQ